MKNLVRLSGIVTVAVLAFLLVTSPAWADTFEFVASGTGSDGPLSAMAVITTSPGMLTIQLSNTLAADVIRSSGQFLSDISFTVSGSLGTLGGTSASGQLGDVSSTGVVTYVAGSPTRWLGVGGGSFSIVGSNITLEAIGGGAPTQLIGPFVVDGGTYTNANAGVRTHNPYVIGPATFVINLSGVTSDTTISNVTFSFGSGPNTFLESELVPEPTSMLLLGTGLCGVAGMLRHKLRTRN